VTARCQGSDQIDLEGINFNNGSIATCATLNFQGIYVLANFKLADDGNGGTILYDPPYRVRPRAARELACRPMQAMMRSSSIRSLCFFLPGSRARHRSTTMAYSPGSLSHGLRGA
jgi:hypothetical protein